MTKKKLFILEPTETDIGSKIIFLGKKNTFAFEASGYRWVPQQSVSYQHNHIEFNLKKKINSPSLDRTKSPAKGKRPDGKHYSDQAYETGVSRHHGGPIRCFDFPKL